MKPLGITLLGLGFLVAVIACFLPISVSSPSSYRSALGYTPPADVINLGLLQRQELAFLGGCAIAVVGAILTGAGAVVEQLHAPRAASTEAAGWQAQPATALPVSDGSIEPEPGTTPRYLVPQATPEEIERGKRADLIFGAGILVVAALLILGFLLAR